MFPDEVSNQDDLAVPQSLFEQSFKDKIAAGTHKIRVEIPTSKSLLKICDLPSIMDSMQKVNLHGGWLTS